jgi:hypothetical protein
MWELISVQKIAPPIFTKMKSSSILGHHYFAQKAPCTSQSSSNLPSTPSSLGLDSMGVIIPADRKSVSIPAADFQSFFVVSEPSCPVCLEGSAHQPLLVAYPLRILVHGILGNPGEFILL